MNEVQLLLPFVVLSALAAAFELGLRRILGPERLRLQRRTWRIIGSGMLLVFVFISFSR